MQRPGNSQDNLDEEEQTGMKIHYKATKVKSHIKLLKSEVKVGGGH